MSVRLDLDSVEGSGHLTVLMLPTLIYFPLTVPATSATVFPAKPLILLHCVVCSNSGWALGFWERLMSPLGLDDSTWGCCVPPHCAHPPGASKFNSEPAERSSKFHIGPTATLHLQIHQQNLWVQIGPKVWKSEKYHHPSCVSGHWGTPELRLSPILPQPLFFFLKVFLQIWKVQAFHDLDLILISAHLVSLQ